MRFLINLLAPAPYANAIEDQEIVKKTYTHWRWRIFLGMYIGYAIFYFTRKSFTFLMPAMVETLGFTKAQLGLLGSILYITYGASKFFSGIIADKSNPRFFMAIGLILTGILNIFFGMSSSWLLFAIFWGMNGFFQGWGWPPCARLLMHWYSQSERGRWWGVWNTSHNIGGAVIPLIVGVLAFAGSWRFGMYVPGVIAIFSGLLLLLLLRDTPQSLGLPPIEVYKNELGTSDDEDNEKEIDPKDAFNEKELTTKEILLKYVLKNKLIWILAFSYFFVYVIRTAINDWGQFFLIEGKGLSIISAGSAIFWFEVGGFFGSLFAGWSSDRFFKGRRGPINVLFCSLVVLAMYMLWSVPFASIFFASIAMFFVGFLIFGPQMLIGMAAAELSHKKAAGTATGFVGWFAYFGAAFGAFSGGKITQSWGWEGYFMAMGICGIFSVFLLLPLWSIRANPNHALSTS